MSHAAFWKRAKALGMVLNLGRAVYEENWLHIWCTCRRGNLGVRANKCEQYWIRRTRIAKSLVIIFFFRLSEFLSRISLTRDWNCHVLTFQKSANWLLQFVNTPRNFPLVFSSFMRTYARAEDNISEELFRRVSRSVCMPEHVMLSGEFPFCLFIT